MINSEVSKQFLMEEDAVKGFKKAVRNNQTNLALRVLSDIIDGLVQNTEVKEAPVVEAAPVVVEKDIPEVQPEVEKKTVSKKAETKE